MRSALAWALGIVLVALAGYSLVAGSVAKTEIAFGISQRAAVLGAVGLLLVPVVYSSWIAVTGSEPLFGLGETRARLMAAVVATIAASFLGMFFLVDSK